MNVHLPKRLMMLLLLLMPLWHWAQTVDLDTYQNAVLSYDFVSTPNEPSVVIQPVNGVLEIIETSNFNYTAQYTPGLNFIGTDQFRIVRWASSPAPHFEVLQVNISVEPALIHANHDFAAVYSGMPVTINVLDNDLSSNGVKEIQAVPAANNGSAVFSITDQNITFVSDEDYQGLAHFNYVICNGSGDCDEGTVSVSVMSMEPVLEDEYIPVFTKKNETQYILVAPDYNIIQNPSNGVFDPTTDVPTYTPNEDYIGADIIRFTDGNHVLVYEIEVLDLAKNTFAFDDRIFTTTNAAVDFYVLENDLGTGSCLSANQPENGTVTNQGGYFTYTPNSGFVGVDQFTYTSYLSACAGDPETATVSVFVSNFEPDRSTFFMATPKETPMIIGYNVPVSTFRFEVSNQGTLGNAFFLRGAITDTIIGGVTISGDNMLIYHPNPGVTSGTDEFEITYCLEDPSNSSCVISKTVKIYMDILDVGNGIGPVCVGDCVWPGDTNFDGIVNMADILPIGLNMGEIGSERETGLTTHWYGQYADDWGDLFANGNASANYDLKHIDTDGNSIVTAIDTMAIRDFYGRTHSMVPAVMPYVPYDFTLRGPLFVEPGDMVSISIHIGTPEAPAEDVYGFVFPFEYNPEFINSAGLEVQWANNNWLAYDSPVLHMQHNDGEAGYLESGYTRTSGISASGYGELGTFDVVIEDIIGFRADEREIPMQFGDISGSVMNGAGEMSQVYVRPLEMRIVLKEEQDALKADDLKVSPNPTNSYLKVHLNGQREFEEVRLFTMTGQEVKTITGLLTNHLEMNLNDLVDGMYILQVTTAEGLINKKIELIK